MKKLPLVLLAIFLIADYYGADAQQKPKPVKSKKVVVKASTAEQVNAKKIRSEQLNKPPQTLRLPDSAKKPAIN